MSNTESNAVWNAIHEGDKTTWTGIHAGDTATWTGIHDASKTSSVYEVDSRKSSVDYEALTRITSSDVAASAFMYGSSVAGLASTGNSNINWNVWQGGSGYVPKWGNNPGATKDYEPEWFTKALDYAVKTGKITTVDKNGNPYKGGTYYKPTTVTNPAGGTGPTGWTNPEDTGGSYGDWTPPPGWATGGVVDQPTFGVFGEAGREALVPLDDKAAGKRILAQILPEFGIPAFASGGIVGSSSRGSQTLISVSFTDFVDSVVYGSTQIAKGLKEGASEWKDGIKESVTTLDDCWNRLKGILAEVGTTPPTPTTPETPTTPKPAEPTPVTPETPPSKQTYEYQAFTKVEKSFASQQSQSIGYVTPEGRQIMVPWSDASAKSLGFMTPEEALAKGINERTRCSKRYLRRVMIDTKIWRSGA